MIEIYPSQIDRSKMAISQLCFPLQFFIRAKLIIIWEGIISCTSFYKLFSVAYVASKPAEEVECLSTCVSCHSFINSADNSLADNETDKVSWEQTFNETDKSFLGANIQGITLFGQK